MLRHSYCLYCFNTIGRVINPEIDRLAVETGRSRLEMVSSVRTYLASTSNQYFGDTKPIIPFNDPLCRLAYLYTSVSANANLVEVIFNTEQTLRSWALEIVNQSGNLSVCTLGGGPGTEILGLSKWIEQRRLNRTVALNCLVTDRRMEWQSSWDSIRDEINGQLVAHCSASGRTCPLTVTGYFMKVDVDEFEHFKDWDIFANYDLFTLCYFLSDKFDSFDNLNRFMHNLSMSSKTGTRFLFIDRDEERWRNQVQELADVAGIHLGPFVSSDRSCEADEEKTDLGQIFQDLKEVRWPRTTWKAFWVVGTKV